MKTMAMKRMSIRQAARGWLGLMVMILVATLGCDRQPGQETYFSTPEESSLRVVTLSPALTQIFKDLGQADLIVGVGQHDAAAPANATIVGTYLDINAEELARLKPTLVFTMAGSEGLPPRLVELSKQIGFMLVSYPYPQTPGDVGNIILRESEMISRLGGTTDEPVAESQSPPSIGALLDMHIKAAELKHTMLFRLAELSKLTKDQGSPMTLMVIGTSPIMASGPGTVLDQLLAMAGGRNVAFDATVGAPTFDREKLLTFRPDVILIYDIGGQALGSVDTDPRLAEFRGLDIPAVRHGQIVLISDAHALLPASTLDKTAGIMAKALHPELVEKIDAILKASRSELIRKNDIDAASPAPVIPPTRPDAAPQPLPEAPAAP